MASNSRDRKSPSGPTAHFKSSPTVAHLATTASAVVGTTVTVLGARLNDRVVASPTSSLPAGACLSHARVSAKDVVTIAIGNLTTTALATFSMQWDLEIISQ